MKEFTERIAKPYLATSENITPQKRAQNLLNLLVQYVLSKRGYEVAPGGGGESSSFESPPLEVTTGKKNEPVLARVQFLPEASEFPVQRIQPIRTREIPVAERRQYPQELPLNVSCKMDPDQGKLSVNIQGYIRQRTEHKNDKGEVTSTSESTNSVQTSYCTNLPESLLEVPIAELSPHTSDALAQVAEGLIINIQIAPNDYRCMMALRSPAMLQILPPHPPAPSAGGLARPEVGGRDLEPSLPPLTGGVGGGGMQMGPNDPFFRYDPPSIYGSTTPDPDGDPRLRFGPGRAEDQFGPPRFRPGFARFGHWL